MLLENYDHVKFTAKVCCVKVESPLAPFYKGGIASAFLFAKRGITLTFPFAKGEIRQSASDKGAILRGNGRLCHTILNLP